MNNKPCPRCADTRLVRFEQPSPPGYLLVPCPRCLPWLRGEAGASLVAHPRDPQSASEDNGIVRDESL